jgi:hypothetical protein
LTKFRRFLRGSLCRPRNRAQSGWRERGDGDGPVSAREQQTAPKAFDRSRERWLADAAEASGVGKTAVFADCCSCPQENVDRKLRLLACSRCDNSDEDGQRLK